MTGESPIDPDVPQTTIVDTDTHVAPTFAELGVSDEIVKALEADGKTHTFAIQELTLPLALAGDDLIGQARTGMGKTFGFGVPLLHRITQVAPGSDGPLRPLDGTPRALVIVPTRELCLQVTGDLQVAGKDIEVDPQPNPKRKLSIVSIYGGRPYESQIAELQAGADVVVGTPGRLLDLAQQGHLILGKVQILVLDEADEMLDLGFLPDIERIMRALPDQRQTMLFSATMPGPIVTLARTFLNRPTHIRAEHAGDSAVHERTTQFVYRAHALDKAELVARVLQAEGRGATMIFTRTKRTAQKVADDLAERGFKVGAVHGDLGQVAREKALGRFRDGSIDVIVATDVAARGIDIDDVTHVINYQCPEDEKAYVHRIGRTGRAGRTGIAVTLVDWDELHKWKIIDDALHLGMPEPAETYSSSDHLRSDLSIPESATGRIAPPAPTEREGTSDGGRREQRAPRANRERRRTRGARSGSAGDAASAKAEKATSDAGASEKSQASSEASGDGGDGSSRPRRRRRRGRGRGGSGEGTAQAAASNATASSDQ
ncbi:DEAD/DEAH box helicase [Williamsia serinedens]|uniref:RNA helicase n=1 Tax=Williamsia serinedens TaxID=391736 RepID=A0ABT1H227_9NOCA|nr:DEAD/DEAH box helicase [Williamsia serinedens]MCP2161295.1 Superfamily II DNA and RNA helicase [Williamsia serinedens]